MQNRHQFIRKAAILIASLDRDAADSLMSQMPPLQARLVRKAMVQLGQIDPEEQNSVIEEFFHVGPIVPQRDPAGIELTDAVARTLNLPTSINDEPEGLPAAKPFHFLKDARIESLAPLLERERPQTIAVVLSHLSPNRAAEILARLPSTLQTEVIHRLIDLEESDPEILFELERGVESWLKQHTHTQSRRCAGLTAVEKILKAAGSADKQNILANLSVLDRLLAQRLKPKTTLPPLTFDDLAQLDASTLITIIAAAESEVTILALSGANGQLVQRILGGLPAPSAKKLQNAMVHLGPTALADVGIAQQELAKLAERLEAQGRIDLSSIRRLSLAA